MAFAFQQDDPYAAVSSDLRPAARPAGPPANAPLIGQPRLPTPQTPTQDAIDQERLRAAQLNNEAAQDTLDPGTVDMLAHQYILSGQLPPLGMGRSATASRQAVLNRAAQVAGVRPGESVQAGFARYRIGVHALQQQEAQLTAIRGNEAAALANGQQYIDRSAELPGQTRFSPLNAISNFVQRRAGGTTITAMDAAHDNFANETARVVAGSPTGAGILSDSARQQWMDVLNSNASLDQKRTALEQLHRDMDNRVNGLSGNLARGYANLEAGLPVSSAGQPPMPPGGYSSDDVRHSVAVAAAVRAAQGLSPEQPDGQGGPPMPGAGGGLPPGGPPGGPGGGGAGTQGMDLTSQTIMNPSQTPRGLGEGATRLEEDPRLRAVAGRLGSMLANTRVGDDQILGFMQQAGVNPADTSIQSILAYRNTPAFARWQRSHPNQAYPIDNTFFTREVPQGLVHHAASWAANSPVGAYLANAGDAVTFGTLDNMTSDPAQTRAGMDALRGQYPGSSLAGTVSGSALGMGALEGGAANLGARGVWAARGADALYGGAYGAGSADDGNRVLGGLEGALAGLGGGAVGRTVQRGAGRVLTGARDEATRFLTDRGIPLTLGQMAGRGGVVGRTIAGLEDKLQSIPLLGDAIRARRQAGVQAFNRAAFDDALAPIGQSTGGTIAEPGVDLMRTARRDGYAQALNGMRVDPNDPAFISAMTRAINVGRRLPGNMADEFAYTIQNRVAPELENGVLTGEGYQAIREGLRQDVKAMSGQPRGHDFATAVGQAESALESLVRRQAPEVVPALNQADQAYRLSQVVRNAVSAGKNTGGVFTPAQLGQAAEANARRFGGNQATTQRPFFDLQRNAQDVLPSTVPNSGTADRAMAAAILPGAAGLAGYETGLISPEHAAMLTAFGLPYTQAGQRTLQTLIARRPDLLRRMGEAAIRTQRVGGTLGRSAAIPMLPSYSGQ